MTTSTTRGTAEALFTRLAGAPELEHEAGNGLREMAALSLTKLADGLVDAKLVLSWLLTALGAPAVFVSALVPIREAGALLPQPVLAARLQAMAQKKWMWVVGTAGQGLGAALLAVSALTLEGAAAGWAFALSVALIALSRAMASTSFKQVTGKTVGKTRRGAVTGVAGSVSAAGVFVFALLMILGILEGQLALAAALGLAAVLFAAAALVFSGLREAASETAAPGNPLAILGLLRREADLRRFVIARGCLVATALTPSYLVMLAGEGSGLSALGALVLASALASLVSSYAWGRFADRSSRTVLAAAGVLGALAMVAALGLSALGLAQAIWAMPAALFVLMIAHHGVRQGRSTYLVDLAPKDEKAAWGAAANIAIGAILLLAGAAGAALAAIGPEAALAGFALLAALGALCAWRLREVEHG